MMCRQLIQKCLLAAECRYLGIIVLWSYTNYAAEFGNICRKKNGGTD